MFDRVDIAHTMVEDARAFYRHGWLLGTSGNLSTRRDHDTFLITASGKDKGRLTESDFLFCNLDGEAAEDTVHHPSAETLVHCVIYARFPDVGAVYHVHEPFAALCSARDEERGSTRFSKLEMIKGLDIWEEDAHIDVPILPNHFDISELAATIAGHLAGDSFDLRVPGLNILRHGFYVWGKTPFEAKRHVETFAYLFRYSWESHRT